MWIEILFGIIAALLCGAYFSRLSPRGEQRAYAQGLVVAASVYVGFVLWGGAPAREILIELGGVLLYGGFAAAGLRRPWMLALGWAAHVGWDVLLHHPAQAWVPSWYPGVCLGFDLAFAVLILLRVGKR